MATVSFRSSMTTNVGTVKIGGDVSKLLSKATQLNAAQANGSGFVAYDLNGDGQADLIETDTFDAAGKATNRQFSETVNGVGYSFSDGNGDGKIDGFSRIASTGAGYSVFDQNFDGKVDSQSTFTKTASHFISDSNDDGTADFRQDSRKATSKDLFDAVPSVLGLQLGGAAFAQLPTGAKQISVNNTPTTHTLGWDLNGDFVADVFKTQQLDANHKVVSTSFSFNLSANADGTPGLSGSASDANGDGKIDNLWFNNAGTGSRSFSDSNNDGKLDAEYNYGTDGSGKGVYDNNGDGKADSVTTWSKIA